MRNYVLIPFLAPPLVFGPLSVSHAPAAPLDAAEAFSIQSLIDPFDLPHLSISSPPEVSQSGEHLDLLNNRLPSIAQSEADTQLQTNDPQRTESARAPWRPLALDNLGQFESSALLSPDFLDAHPAFPLQPTLSHAQTPSPLNEYAELARHTQMRRKGPFQYSLKINTAAIYDDNVSLAQTEKRRDLQLSIGPQARIQLGSDESALRLGANYAGAASWFLRTPDQRTYDQNLGIDGSWNGKLVKTGFRLGFQSTHNASRDAGERTGRKIFYAGTTSSFPLGAKTSGDLSLDATKSTFSGLLGSHEYRVQEFLNYQLTPKLQIGTGATEGLLEADAGTRQTYLQALVRISAQPTGKLAFSASAGNEWRHYDSGQPSPNTPVFLLGASWQATAQTNIALEARRRIYASAALESQNYTATNVSLTAREMVTATLDASISVGFENATYQSTSAGVSADRRDDFWFTRLGLDWQLRRNFSIGSFYEFSSNDSTGTQSHSFRRNRIGVTAGISF